MKFIKFKIDSLPIMFLNRHILYLSVTRSNVNWALSTFLGPLWPIRKKRNMIMIMYPNINP